MPRRQFCPCVLAWVQLLRRVPQTPGVENARRHLAGEGAVPGEGNVAKFRAYDAVLEALREVAAGAGLLCLLDDLHAADQASLELLVLVAGDVQRMPILIAATLRDTEPSEALDRTLGELLLRGSERLAVAPLALAEVDALVDECSGRAPVRRSRPRCSSGREAMCATSPSWSDFWAVDSLLPGLALRLGSRRSRFTTIFVRMAARKRNRCGP